MASECVYLSLGSNIGQSCALISAAFTSIAALPEVKLIKTSRLYCTTPVSPIPQRDFINAACTLHTTLSADALYDALHKIEVQLGKVHKHKNAPRAIDIDILFFGTRFYNTPKLCIPHPRWKERLFVLIPLLDLTEEIAFPTSGAGPIETLNLKEFLHSFSNPHNERVSHASLDC